ncbi:hypothetical protein [Photobacterium sp. 1_MG-2023]|uniref:hypothetical protein n=1 Tax=Photobacterium sp. 1_MG-2023 TaxID=3062646 RepID=UPI0026E1DBD7|nr:hypothetical protein [Photobacterium sp. 1_MG-2023]MDO6708998.1 hypothetical protein [Photobacterium sp. 1_MG-2023]
MVKILDVRFNQLIHVIDTLNSTLDRRLVKCSTEDAAAYINFDYFPVDRDKCRLSVTIDKNPPYLLTVNIGRKIFYEEYEGQALPDANYLDELIKIVMGGRVLEKETFFWGRCVIYSGSVIINGYDDILVVKKLMPYFLVSSGNEKIYSYKSWF